MAPLIAHIIRAMTTDDLFGISSVSGLYGPGSWTAWYLTLATSWIAVIRNDHSHNLHHIGFLLYTNWAAVDIIWRTLHILHEESAEQIQPKGPLAAAIAVTWWGAVHASSQYAYICLGNILWISSVESSRKRRSVILELGILIPAFAGFMVYIYAFKDDGYTQHLISREEVIPALYWDGMALSLHQRFIGHFMAGPLWYMGVCYLIQMTTTLMEQLDNWEAARVIISFCYFIFGAAPAAFLSTRYIFALLASGGGIWKESCFFMPCAPQGLWDWDQAFALFAGLVMVAYEMGPVVLQMFRRIFGKRRFDTNVEEEGQLLGDHAPGPPADQRLENGHANELRRGPHALHLD